MSDKTEYSRLLLKRSAIPGEVPTATSATTLNQMVPTDLFVGEMFVNVADDLMWVRTDNGILPISLSGSTGTTTTPDLMTVLAEGNITGVQDIIVSSGASIVYEYLPTGSTNSILAVDADGRTIITSVSGSTGSSGSSGTSGLSGVNGTNGTSGIDGTNGSSGTSGLSGVNGTSGTSGSSGLNGISAGRTYYFNQSETSDIADYKVLSDEPSTATTQTITVSLPGSTNDNFVQQFITDELGFNVIPSGVQRFFLQFTKPAENDDISAYVVLQLTDFSGGTIGSPITSSIEAIGWNGTNPYELFIDVVLPTTAISPTNRMSVAIYLNNYDATTHNTTFYTENGNYSFVLTSVGVVAGTSGTSGTSGINGSNGTSGTSGVDGVSTGVLGITIDGGGSVITTGVKGYLVVPYNATIQSWYVVSDVSGSIVLDVWKGSSLTIPTTSGSSITGTEKPTLTSQQINSDTSLSTWTTSLSTGDVIAFNVDSASTLTRATIEITLQKI